MRCPDCLRELADSRARCNCASVVVAAPESALRVHAAASLVLAEAAPLTAEARLASSVALGFRRLVDSPQLARPLGLMKSYWPVAVVPTTIAVIAGVGVKTSLTLVGNALLWGLSLAAQLLGTM